MRHTPQTPTAARVVAALAALCLLTAQQHAAAEEVLVIGGLLSNRTDFFHSVALWTPGEPPVALGGPFPTWISVVYNHGGVLIAAGGFQEVAGTVVNSIAVWDGRQWGPLQVPITSTAVEINALATYKSDLIVGGSFETAGGVPASNLARWDGQRWSALGTGAPGAVNTMVVYRGELVIGGKFAGPLRWLEAEGMWAMLAGGTDGSVLSMVVWGNVLVVGGAIGSVGGGTVNGSHIAQWDGSSSNWSALGTGIAGDPVRCYALEVYNGDLIAGGVFTKAGDVDVLNVARWDGAAWHALAAGLDGNGPYGPNAFASVYGLLAAGGDFYTSGKVPLLGFALWDGSSWANGHVLGDYWITAYSFTKLNATVPAL